MTTFYNSICTTYQSINNYVSFVIPRPVAERVTTLSQKVVPFMSRMLLKLPCQRDLQGKVQYLSSVKATALSTKKTVSHAFFSLVQFSYHNMGKESAVAAFAYDLTYGSNILSLHSATGCHAIAIFILDYVLPFSLNRTLGRSQPTIVSFLLAIGADPNTSVNRVLPLHKAIFENDFPSIDLLLKANANPHAKDTDLSSPLALACGKSFFDNGKASSLKSVKMLLRITNRTDLQECRDIHALFAKIFPPFLPENINDNEPFPSWMPFVSPFSHEMPDSPPPTPYQVLPSQFGRFFNVLYQGNARLQKLWNFVNRPMCIIIQELPENTFTNGNGRTFSKEDGAWYDQGSHTISLNKESPIEKKITTLIFELCNAAQRVRFQKVRELALVGKLGREQYTFLREKIEHESYLLANSVYGYKKIDTAMVPSTAWEMLCQDVDLVLANEYKENPLKLSAQWQLQNTSFSSETMSHADHIRRTWDLGLAAEFFAQNPNLLQS